MNTTPSLHSHQSTAIRSVFATLLLGAAAITLSCASADAASANTSKKQQADTQTQPSGHLRDNHRVYNPITGNFEEAPPYGPRTNK